MKADSLQLPAQPWSNFSSLLLSFPELGHRCPAPNISRNPGNAGTFIPALTTPVPHSFCDCWAAQTGTDGRPRGRGVERKGGRNGSAKGKWILLRRQDKSGAGYTRHPPGSPARTASPGRSCSESSQPRNFALPRQKNNLPSCRCGMYREDERKSSGKPFPALLEGLAGGCKWIRSPLGSMAQLIRIPGPLSFILKVLFQSTSDTCNAPVGAATPLISFRDRCV